jgi:hypothetical protein
MSIWLAKILEMTARCGDNVGKVRRNSGKLHIVVRPVNRIFITSVQYVNMYLNK